MSRRSVTSVLHDRYRWCRMLGLVGDTFIYNAHIVVVHVDVCRVHRVNVPCSLIKVTVGCCTANHCNT